MTQTIGSKMVKKNYYNLQNVRQDFFFQHVLSFWMNLQQNPICLPLLGFTLNKEFI